MATILNAPDDRNFHVWKIDELYFGEETTNEVYLPKVGDLVVDLDVGWYSVKSVGDDGIPVLELKSRFSNVSEFNYESTSLITAISNYQPTAIHEAFINKGHDPYVVNVDAHYRVYGSDTDHMVFYLGTDTSEDGTVISEVYDGDDNLISDKVDLEELVSGEANTKIPVSFRTTQELNVGDVITGVCFTDSGGNYSSQSFVVRESGIVRPTGESDVYITGIGLTGDMISDDDETLIQNTAGTSISTASLTGILYYSDGSKTEVAIDGTKMVLHGLDSFDSTFVGRPTNVTLTYYPSSDEPYINGGMGTTASISKVFTLANIVTDDDFTLKLFCIPHWDDDNTAYTLEWRVGNVDGDLDVDVSDDVSIVLADGGDFSYTDFTTCQSVTLSLDMDTISSTLYDGYVHTQKMTITLDQPGAVSGQYWLLDYVGDETNIYGSNVTASIATDGSAIDLSQGLSLEDDWLSVLYYPIEPLFDNTELDSAATPTHFIVEYDGVSTGKYEISEWSNVVSKTDDMSDFTLKSTVIVKFILETTDKDQILALAPVYISSEYS